MRAFIAGLLVFAGFGLTPSMVVARGQFAEFIMRESWSGLIGTVTIDGEETELPVLLWEVVIPEKRRFQAVVPWPIDPRNRRKFPTSQPQPADWQVVDDVLVRVRGKDVRFHPAPRKTTLVGSDFDGRWLSVGERPESSPLTLLKDRAAASVWKIRTGQRTVWRHDHGRDGFQFEVTAKAQWKMESVEHPGWFLGLREKRLVLVPNIDDAAVIEFSQQRFFDDLSDGK